jgi:hypothetical protein
MTYSCFAHGVWESVLLVAVLYLGVAGATPLTAAPDEQLPVLPVDLWTTTCQPGDSATLTADDGCLRIRYDVNVHALHQVSWQSFKQASIDLYLAKPLPLTSEQTRICFEAQGLNSDGDPSVLLTPVIRDEHGELLIYTPYPYPHLHAGTSNWSKWCSRYLYTAEAGGAASNIYEAEGGDGNAWPDGALTLLGFRLQIRPNAFGRQQGEVVLGSVETAGMKIAYADPYIYADSLFKEKGDYRVACRICDEFQGKPLREFVTKLTYDPQNPQSRKQRISFPLGPDNNYWISYQITDATGKVIAGDKMRYQAEGNTAATIPTPPDLHREPVLGYLRINPDTHTTGVYSATEPLTVMARVFPKGANSLTLAWELDQYAYHTCVEREQTLVEFHGKAYKDIPIHLAGEGGRDAYRLQLTLRDGTSIVDTQEYILGRQADFSKPYASFHGKIADRDYVKQSAYFRVTYFPPEGSDHPQSEDALVTHFNAFLDEGSQMTRYITYMIDPAEFEILPGVYDFHLLDRIMDAAATRGCCITVRIGHSDQMMPYTWLRNSGQYSFDGTRIAGHPFYGAYALTDESFKQCWLNAYSSLYKRYRTHPGFQGYYLMNAGGEWGVLDQPWTGDITGYEQSTRPAFRRYLQTTLHLTLEQLNARWGVHYQSWDDVVPPQPDLLKGKLPDLRMSWLDFTAFKAALDASWFQQTAASIRTYDPNHVIIAYTSNPEGLIGVADYLHNGGNHYLQGEGKLVSAWEGGLGWITEPHHPYRWAAYGDPGEAGWVLDWSVYVMMAQAGGGGANLHLYYYPDPLSLPAHYGGANAYDRFELFKPILRELHSVKIATPVKEVGVLQDPYTLYCKHRTMFASREEDLKRWFELCKVDAVDYEDMRPENYAHYKLLLPNILDEVMSRDNIQTLDRLVRNGAHMIIAANTGKYCPELDEAPFQLLKQLGITPPAGPYVQQEKGVVAEAIAENPLFANGAKVTFFTQADMKVAMQSPEVRDNYMTWPYRWIPETDYFGYYKDNLTTNGRVLARFPSGAVALSLHQVGLGAVLVFWGTPDYTPEQLKGMMAKAASWANIHSSRLDSPVPYTQEGDSASLHRHYAMMYQETAGEYQQRLPLTPDGNWFLDDLVSGQRLGTYTGKELREQGLPVSFEKGYSPLKIIRMIPVDQASWGGIEWLGKYRQPAK